MYLVLCVFVGEAVACKENGDDDGVVNVFYVVVVVFEVGLKKLLYNVLLRFSLIVIYMFLGVVGLVFEMLELVDMKYV